MFNKKIVKKDTIMGCTNFENKSLYYKVHMYWLMFFKISYKKTFVDLTNFTPDPGKRWDLFFFSF